MSDRLPVVLVTGDSIPIECEGSGCPALVLYRVATMTLPTQRFELCSMCGQHVACDSAGNALLHTRDRVSTSLRGDFG